MAVQYNPGIVTDGLVLCLDAANRKSYPGTGTGWNDLSTIGNNGTFLNGVTFQNQNNGNIVFDGTDDYVSTSLTMGTAFTWNAWFKTDVVSSGFRNILSVASPNYMLVLLNCCTPNLGFWNNDSTSGDNLNTDTISINTWYNITYVREGNSTTNGYKAYLNGIFKGGSNSGVWSSTDPLTIGGRTDVAQFLDGNIAYVAIYNKVLSAEQILQNFNALRGRFGI